MQGCLEPWQGPSFLACDEVLADHLRDVPVKRDGELIFFDAFDLAVAEHRMKHGVANRELRNGSNSDGFFYRFCFVVNRRFFPRLSSWLGSDHGTIDRWLSPRGRTGMITELGGSRLSCAQLGQCLCLSRRSW